MLPDKIYNYYALTAAVLNPALTVDDAISHFSPPTKRRSSRNYEPAEVDEIVRLRTRVTNREIGAIYGLSKNAIASIIHRYKRRKQACQPWTPR